ncbi:MAG: tRNA threonylcarbamoyladenosine biosynthesis protein TsaE [Candidatus Hepatoplasma vulgare]|nr:MAG: tRNA threonylcarbamoyladenosine biosynthesis protein TsaE [Candidatus Hepatoplasma sp.]
MKKEYFTNSETETIKLGEFFFELAKKRNVKLIFLKGNYGSGKTFFTKGFAKALSINEKIKSPSFNKKFVYKNFVHYDLYNLKRFEIEDYKNQILEDIEFNFVIVEWSENILIKKYKKYFYKYFLINLEVINDNERKFILKYINK